MPKQIKQTKSLSFYVADPATFLASVFKGPHEKIYISQFVLLPH